MQPMLSITLILVTYYSCYGYVMSDPEPEWDGLMVKYALNLLDPTSFAKMPRTESEAISEGFKMISSCETSTKFVGKRYWKNNDAALILIYDGNGYIAGIQAGISKYILNGYPSRRLRPDPFVEDGKRYYITNYFVDPATVCTGRNAGQFESQGTGVDLYIQNGNNPDTDHYLVPKLESDLESTLWKNTRCFYTMGQHYFYDIKRWAQCDDLYPVFLLYNNGRLNAFGWVFPADIFSRRLEHLPKPFYGAFLNPIPACLYLQGSASSMHIFLTDSILNNRC